MKLFYEIMSQWGIELSYVLSGIFKCLVGLYIYIF